jgi:hypothetical protein
MKININDIYSFWVDYIEVLWTLKKLYKVNYWLYNIIIYCDSLFPWLNIRRYDSVTNYSFRLVFDYKWINCYVNLIWMENWVITNVDYLVLNCVAFVLFSELYETIEFINIEMYYSKLIWFDLNLDVLNDIKTIHENFMKLNQKWRIFFDDCWYVLICYIWEKKNNRYKLVRDYNKKDNILIKKKQKLYPGYLNQKYINCLEIELRSELAKNCNLNSLLDKSYIFDVFLVVLLTILK